MAVSDNFWVGLLPAACGNWKKLVYFLGHFCFLFIKRFERLWATIQKRVTMNKHGACRTCKRGERGQGKEENTEYCSVGVMSVGGMEKMLQFSWIIRRRGTQRVGFSLSVKYKHRWILSLVSSCFSLCTAGMFLRSCPLQNFTKWKPWTLHNVIIITPAILLA